MGSIQFLKGPDEKVYYRAYGKDGLKGKGCELDLSDPSAIHDLPFKPMDMKFQVLAWLPQAEQPNHRLFEDIVSEKELVCSVSCEYDLYARLARGTRKQVHRS